MDQFADNSAAGSGDGLFRRLTGKQSAAVDIPCGKDKVPTNTPYCSFDSRTGNPFCKMGYGVRGSNGIDLVCSGEYIGDPGSILSLQPCIYKRTTSQRDEQMEMLGGSNCSVILRRAPARYLGTLRSSKRRQHHSKGLTLDNCLVPQLYGENFDIEEHVGNSFTSRSAKVARSFAASNVNRVISPSGCNRLDAPLQFGLNGEVSEMGSEMVKTVIGVPPLKDLRKLKRKGGDLHDQRDSKLVSNKLTKLPDTRASLRGMLFFSLGIGIGVFCSSILSQQEVSKLNNELKRSENLVQDLQEELEMRDSMTVKELPDEGCGRTEEDGIIHTQLPEVEPMSEIEAELEAELERLALNMNGDCPDARTPSVDEVDREMVGDVVHGELRAELLRWEDHSSPSHHSQDSETVSTHGEPETNYPVCPKDLTLRLHEVIRERLEGRIKELESALAQKQNQMHLMELERGFSERTVSNSDAGSSSNHGSPTQESIFFSRPFALSPAVDALDVCNEACDLSNCPDPKKKRRMEESRSLASNLLWGKEDRGADESTFSVRLPWEQMPASGGSNGAVEHGMEIDDDGEYNDSDDDDGKLLIQQLVEQRKQGSSAMIQAQRLLLSLDQ